MTQLVSIGVCAYNEVRRIAALLDSLLDQSLPEDFVLKEIIVVASGCTDGTDRLVEERTKVDARLVLIRESERLGKSSALNKILSRYEGDILILVNADARLFPGAVFGLLQVFALEDGIEIACGFPKPEPSPNRVLNVVEDVWWRLHSRTLQTLSDMGDGNHCCDEFMAMKRGFADSIPKDVINDGAYFGVLGALRGVTVRFCPRATVAVETPTTLIGLLRQRRRIIAGHHQVASILGRAPYTLEGLARRQPLVAARILAVELYRQPVQTFAFTIIALPLEIVAHLLALLDRTRAHGYQPAWPVVE